MMEGGNEASIRHADATPRSARQKPKRPRYRKIDLFGVHDNQQSNHPSNQIDSHPVSTFPGANSYSSENPIHSKATVDIHSRGGSSGRDEYIRAETDWLSGPRAGRNGNNIDSPLNTGKNSKNSKNGKSSRNSGSNWVGELEKIKGREGKGSAGPSFNPSEPLSARFRHSIRMTKESKSTEPVMGMGGLQHRANWVGRKSGQKMAGKLNLKGSPEARRKKGQGFKWVEKKRSSVDGGGDHPKKEPYSGKKDAPFVGKWVSRSNPGGNFGNGVMSGMGDGMELGLEGQQGKEYRAFNATGGELNGDLNRVGDLNGGLNGGLNGDGGLNGGLKEVGAVVRYEEVCLLSDDSLERSESSAAGLWGIGSVQTVHRKTENRCGMYEQGFGPSSVGVGGNQASTQIDLTMEPGPEFQKELRHGDREEGEVIVIDGMSDSESNACGPNMECDDNGDSSGHAFNMNWRVNEKISDKFPGMDNSGGDGGVRDNGVVGKSHTKKKKKQKWKRVDLFSNVVELGNQNRDVVEMDLDNGVDTGENLEKWVDGRKEAGKNKKNVWAKDEVQAKVLLPLAAAGARQSFWVKRKNVVDLSNASNDVEQYELKCGLRSPEEMQKSDLMCKSHVRVQKDFECIEKVNGRKLNLVGGLELYENVLTPSEQKQLVSMVEKWMHQGECNELLGRTYAAPKKWMKGKGRRTVQFGCCYNYATDSKDRPPGILIDEPVEAMPAILQGLCDRLVRWGILPKSKKPNSGIINVYDVGDCIPPHIDNHDFERPFVTISLLSKAVINFGIKLRVMGPGEFSASHQIQLLPGSCLVLKGNGADVAQHCIPGVKEKRISITLRKMKDQFTQAIGHAIATKKHGWK